MYVLTEFDLVLQQPQLVVSQQLQRALVVVERVGVEAARGGVLQARDAPAHPAQAAVAYAALRRHARPRFQLTKSAAYFQANGVGLCDHGV